MEDKSQLCTQDEERRFRRDTNNTAIKQLLLLLSIE